MSEAPQEQNGTYLVSVSESGLSVRINGKRHSITWAKVSSIAAGASKRDGNLVFVAIGIDGEDGERSLIVGENDPIWIDLLALLHVCLPVAPLEAWAAGIAAIPGAYTLYRRSAHAKME
ncbi:hypothetical protein [Sphingopyxis terrae]|uniref:hypothetical protein n=1 Tax=Sphingopyxis terrae TaxID=33052 RepID=UPI000A8C4265|nr:hypothetical protein [Sphingopyxis terrae]